MGAAWRRAGPQGGQYLREAVLGHGTGGRTGGLEHFRRGMAHGHASATLGRPGEQVDVVAAVTDGQHPVSWDLEFGAYPLDRHGLVHAVGRDVEPGGPADGIGRPVQAVELRVGKAGTACHSRSSGTSAVMAMVAACSSSATSGPTRVKPTSTFLSSSTTMRACPSYPSACRAAAGTALRLWSTARARMPASAAVAAVRPTEATSGSVNTTWGMARSSAVTACRPHARSSTLAQRAGAT